MNLKLIFEQGDMVLVAVFLSLVLMSILTWTVIIVRAMKLYKAKKSNRKMTSIIWEARDLHQAALHAEQHISHGSSHTLSALAAK